jgi:hypothetical protein
MKKHTIIRIGILFMLPLLFCVFIRANAQLKDSSNLPENNWIKFAGSKNGKILFDIFYLNPAGKRLRINISDQNHNNLFEESYTDKEIHKTFQLPSDAARKLEFVLSGAQHKVLVQSFDISTETKFYVKATSSKH